MISGELDTQEAIPTTEIGWLRKNMASALQLKPYLGNSYIIFNFLRHKFDDRRLREAMSLAYDRESATEKILRLGDPPAYAFVPPGTANYPPGASLRFSSPPFVQRLERARTLMAELGYGPTRHFHASYLTFATDNARRLAAAFQAMMRRIYIDIDIYNTDPAIYYRTLADHNFELAA
jgi:oligopeptide transport system substrate-binding protein